MVTKAFRLRMGGGKHRASVPSRRMHILRACTCSVVVYTTTDYRSSQHPPHTPTLVSVLPHQLVFLLTPLPTPTPLPPIGFLTTIHNITLVAALKLNQVKIYCT